MKKIVKCKRILSAAACVSVAALALAGCGNPQAAKEDNGSKPILKAMGVYQKDDYNAYPVAKVLEERTGYHVEYDMLPQDKWEEKLNLVMASGDSYDIVTIMGSGRARYIDYAEQGALIELGPLIDQYAPNIKAHVAESSLEEATVDGKLYGIPNGSAVKPGNTVANTAIAVRADLLEQAGIQKPETLEEFTQFLREIKAKDPGGNGSNNIPMVISSTPEVNGLMGAFGIENMWNTAEDGTLRHRVNTPAYEDYLKYMHALYTEGLIDNEFPTNKSATTIEKFTSGRAVVMPMSWVDAPNVMAALHSSFPDARVEYLNPIASAEGQRGLQAGKSGSGMDRITFIPKTAKHPEDAVKWMNAKLEPETFKLMTIGEEGIHYTVKDGEYYPIQPAFLDERGSANNFMNGIDKDNYPDYWMMRVRKDAEMEKYFDLLNTDLKEYHETTPAAGSPMSSATAKNLQAMNQMAADNAVKFVVGSNDFSQFSKFVEEWKAAGGEQYIKELNEWKATKN